MSQWPKAFATACIFLTRLPMPRFDAITAQDEGRSLIFFPLVGLIIGGLLCLLAMSLFSVFPPLVLAALLTAFWAAVTGGLHLDGLADSADGWLGGLGDVNRSLEIMHDSRCGSGALVAVTCLLVVKFAVLTVIVQQQLWLALLVAPILGRGTGPLLFLPGAFPYTPYVQPTGISKNFIDYCPNSARATTLFAVLICLLLIGIFYSLKMMLIVIGLNVFMLFLLRRLMLKRLGGSTGDTAGATTEIIEVTTLLACIAEFYN